VHGIPGKRGQGNRNINRNSNTRRRERRPARERDCGSGGVAVLAAGVLTAHCTRELSSTKATGSDGKGREAKEEKGRIDDCDGVTLS
jgi:hypothetical protein